MKAPEIFRHLRPHHYDPRTEDLEPFRLGGISALLLPSGEKRYDYWIYICPMDCPFSAKQAIKSLREIVERGTIPWGTLTLTTSPLLQQLEDDLLRETELGTDVTNLVQIIQQINKVEAVKMLSAQR